MAEGIAFFLEPASDGITGENAARGRQGAGGTAACQRRVPIARDPETALNRELHPLPTSAAEIASAIESLPRKRCPRPGTWTVSGLAPLSAAMRAAWSFDATWVADGKSVSHPA